MEAVILAGGQGTRLRPYTADLPKALVPVCGYPVIEILLKQLKRLGFTTVHIAVNHLAHRIETELNDGSRFGLNIRYSHEPQPLSTVGPIGLITDLPETFLVANGDVLTDVNYRELLQAHQKSGCKLTVATCVRTDRMQYGVFEVDARNRVTSFIEKPSFQFRVSMGVYVFSKSLLEFVPPATHFGFDDLVEAMLAKGEPINTVLHEGFWLDIGSAEDYIRANTQGSAQIRRLIEGI